MHWPRFLFGEDRNTPLGVGDQWVGHFNSPRFIARIQDADNGSLTIHILPMEPGTGKYTSEKFDGIVLAAARAFLKAVDGRAMREGERVSWALGVPIEVPRLIFFESGKSNFSVVLKTLPTVSIAKIERGAISHFESDRPLTIDQRDEQMKEIYSVLHRPVAAATVTEPA